MPPFTDRHHAPRRSPRRSHASRRRARRHAARSAPERPLRRSVEDRLLGGVCGGLARRLRRGRVGRSASSSALLVPPRRARAPCSTPRCGCSCARADESDVDRLAHPRRPPRAADRARGVHRRARDADRARGHRPAGVGTAAWPLGLCALGGLVVWRGASRRPSAPSSKSCSARCRSSDLGTCEELAGRSRCAPAPGIVARPRRDRRALDGRASTPTRRRGRAARRGRARARASSSCSRRGGCTRSRELDLGAPRARARRGARRRGRAPARLGAADPDADPAQRRAIPTRSSGSRGSRSASCAAGCSIPRRSARRGDAPASDRRRRRATSSARSRTTTASRSSSSSSATARSTTTSPRCSPRAARPRVNAAKWSGAPIDLGLRRGRARRRHDVRPRPRRGLRPRRRARRTAAASRDSIVERIERARRAPRRSAAAPGEGTEVELTMPRRPRRRERTRRAPASSSSTTTRSSARGSEPSSRGHRRRRRRGRRGRRGDRADRRAPARRRAARRAHGRTAAGAR